ncbi:ICE-like protease (caspase) p20 domain protein [Rhizoctonia solani AG-3 Rhs1AP]|uniref:ICE-like protease (Caspase) p20 domain protein n=2 Tax=Rhizoctonia solani AG-3 TaxID=1086053 RepID=A0A074RMM3_9AGAM|nr:ICE-like protease (caspase) p20 domain protein [Rhizoctonia solani AG-3 Rhs1AP]KEP48099.1 ICE-like protease (caspase) p20 domain protein [Rhizoctonia solani 123E]
MSTYTDGTNVTFAPRAVVNQPVVEDHSKRSFVEQYIQKAIEDGDNMDNTSRPVPEGGVQRRALIIAPEYEDYSEDKLPALPATATDVKLVHELLVTFGYERQNIRILCDVCAGNGYSYPTRKNILDSLEWLTSDVTPNAYRFLHFSGHGVHILSDDKNGKEIRDSDWNPYKEPQTLDTERSNSEIPSQRVKNQMVLRKELKYYNEAIATRKDVSDKVQPRDVILDSQLNLYLSKLPPDCTITCTLDCCASGRMLNLPVKVAGSGFRGSLVDNDKKTNITSSLNVEEDNVQPQTEPGQPIESRGKHNLATAAGSELHNINNARPEDVSSESGGVLAISNLFNLFSLDGPTAQVRMHENLPEKEKRMNHVRARIISWSASHQRQEAWNSKNGYAGLFTKAFTQACLTLRNDQANPRVFTYEQLYNEASRIVESQRMEFRFSRPQYVQLWSYLTDDEQTTKDQLMRSHVVF